MDDNLDVANLAAGGSKKYGISLGSNPYNPGAIQNCLVKYRRDILYQWPNLIM
jgi:hypothetical protein